MLHGRARAEIARLARELGVEAVYANHDYEPAAKERDAEVARALAAAEIEFHPAKDQVIFERDEVLTGPGARSRSSRPTRTPGSKKLDAFFLKAYPVAKYAGRLAPPPARRAAVARGDRLRRDKSRRAGDPDREWPARSGCSRTFSSASTTTTRRRDYPAIKGLSYLSVHLRFGTISIRELAATRALASGRRGAETWLSELVWRDFYFAGAVTISRTSSTTRSSRSSTRSRCTNDDATVRGVVRGRTGYPLVDAAMRQLNQTGYMHNRLRMVAASFLVKDLHVDWRWGERYFADRLNDFDLAANNGGWQWAASTGCDAQPYFRIFNPVTQSEKFDPEGKFIRKLRAGARARAGAASSRAVEDEPGRPGGGGLRDRARTIPPPVVDHARAREIALDLYGRARKRREDAGLR